MIEEAKYYKHACEMIESLLKRDDIKEWKEQKDFGFYIDKS